MGFASSCNSWIENNFVLEGFKLLVVVGAGLMVSVSALRLRV